MPGYNGFTSANNAPSAVSGALEGAGDGASKGGVSPWGAVIGAGIGGVTGMLGGLFGDSGPPNGGKPYSLPPELELQMLQRFDQAMQEYDMMYQQNQQMYQAYSQRIDALDKMNSATMPQAEALNQLNQSTQQLAMMFGGDAKKLAESGFMDDYTKSYMEQAQSEYAKLGTTSNTNPVLEQQIADQRRQLEQDLARSGVGPAQRSIALQQFESQANQNRFQANNEIGQARIGALGQIQGNVLQARGQNYNQALGSYGAQFNFLQNQQGMYQQGFSNAAGLNQQRFAGGQQYLQMGSQLNAAGQQMYNQLGQYNFSDRTQAGLESGLVGPGSWYQQTGVAGSAMGDYKSWVATGERLRSTGGTQEGYGGGRPLYGPQGYSAFKDYQNYGGQGRLQGNWQNYQSGMMPFGGAFNRYSFRR